MKVLNARYTLKKTPTDVLSFRLADPSPRQKISGRKLDGDLFDIQLEALKDAPYLDLQSKKIIMPREKDVWHRQGMPEIPEIPRDLGTIFLSVEYCHYMARKRGMRRHDYILLATVHGLAHLVGHDHKTPKSHSLMKKAEEQALAALCLRFSTVDSDMPTTKTAFKYRSDMPQSYL